jgi:hypothetical protein
MIDEKQFEQCTLEEATHVEMGCKMYELGNGIVHKRICFGSYHGLTVFYDGFREGNSIYTGVFPVLGIKPLKEKKREPIEFTYTVGGGIAPPNEAYGKTFRCVEILEEKNEQNRI